MKFGRSSYFVRFQLCSTGFNFGEYGGSHSKVNQSGWCSAKKAPPHDARYIDPKSESPGDHNDDAIAVETKRDARFARFSAGVGNNAISGAGEEIRR